MTSNAPPARSDPSSGPSSGPGSGPSSGPSSGPGSGPGSGPAGGRRCGPDAGTRGGQVRPAPTASPETASPETASPETASPETAAPETAAPPGSRRIAPRPTAPRARNRRRGILDAAARRFARQGFHAASMRGIAAAAGMLPGSLYYHFPSKDELLLAVYQEGVRRIAERLDAAVARADLPWTRLEAACVAHLEMLLEAGGDYAQVVIRVRPQDCPAMAPQLVALRDAHEDRFKALIAALDLPQGAPEGAPGGAPGGADRQALRLMILGALNWTQTWYRPGGDPPAVLARRFLALLRGGSETGANQAARP